MNKADAQKANTHKENQKPDSSASIEKAWDIQFSSISIEQQLGKGAFGVVYKGKWRNIFVAVKKLPGELTEEQLDEFVKEAAIMSKLRPHDNVIQFLGVCQNPAAIVTKFYELGSLAVYITTNKVSEKTMFKMLQGISAGMTHLHAENMVHRDLAARNILLQSVNNEIRAIVSDFGFAREVDSEAVGGTTQANIGPVRWMAPESLRDKVYSYASDSWAFGVTVWELYNPGQLPWAPLDHVNTILAVLSGKKLELPGDMNPELKQLSVDCWLDDSTSRPTFQKIYDKVSEIEKRLE